MAVILTGIDETLTETNLAAAENPAPPPPGTPTARNQQPQTNPQATQKKQDAGAQQAANFDSLGGLQQLIAFLFMTLLGQYDPNAAGMSGMNNFFGNIMGFADGNAFKQWHGTDRSNWQQSYDFNKFNFGAAGKFSMDNLPPSGSADFDFAIKQVLKSEGGLSNHAADRGGLTKFGIDTRSNAGYVRERFGINIRDLTIEQATQIYKEKYWDKVKGLDDMPRDLATVVFDAAVNHGPGYPAKNLFPEMKAKFGLGDDPAKWEDEATKNGHSVNDLTQWALQRRSVTYDRIVASNPSQAVFRKGWENRLTNLAKYIRDNPAETPAPSQPAVEDTRLAQGQPAATPQEPTTPSSRTGTSFARNSDLPDPLGIGERLTASLRGQWRPETGTAPAGTPAAEPSVRPPLAPPTPDEELTRNNLVAAASLTP